MTSKKRTIEWLAGSALVYVLVVACGGDGTSASNGTGGQGTEGPIGTGSYGGLVDDLTNPVADAQAAEDGTRVVNQYQTSTDGLRWPTGVFYDTQLGLECGFVKANDGIERCLPTDIGDVRFADASCSQPIYRDLKDPCDPPPTYGKSVLWESGTCNSDTFLGMTIYELTSETLSASGVYSRTRFGVCEYHANDLTWDYFILTEVPAATFAQGSIQYGK